jgi:hypothetical protein
VLPLRTHTNSFIPRELRSCPVISGLLIFADFDQSNSKVRRKVRRWASEGGEGWQDFSFFFLFLPLSSGVSSILGQGTTAGRSCRSETVRDPSETLHPVPLHLVLGPSRTLVP